MKTIKALFLALSCTLILIACDPPAAMPTPGDTTPPTWTVGPAAADITLTSFRLSATLNEAGTIYWVLLADGAEAPSAAAIVAGTAGTASSRGNFPAPADTAVRSDPITGVVAGTAYDVYLVAVDTAGNQSMRIKIDLPADRTAPTLTAAATNLASASFTLSATLNEAGNIYYLVLPDGTDAPDPAAIVATAILDGLGTVITTIDSGNFQALADTAVTRSITGLTVNIAYDVYLVGVDTDDNQSTRIMIDLPADRTAPAWTVDPSGSASTADGFTVTATLNEAATIYYVALSGGDAPSAATIVAETAGTANSRGNFPATAGTQVSHGITRLVHTTDYTVYFVAQDSAMNNSVLKSVTISTLDRTAPTWFSGPFATPRAPTSFMLSATLNEAGRIYYVLLADNATAPSAAAIVADTAGTGGNFPTTIVIGGFNADSSSIPLTAGTAYDVYLVAVDTAGNQSTRVKIDLPADRTGPTWNSPTVTSRSSSSVVVTASLSESGVVAYAVLPDGQRHPPPLPL